MLHLVKEIIKIQAFILTLKFNTGEILDVNLESKLREWSNEPDSLYKQLLNPEYFKTVKYDESWETIFWDNGIELCADVLYDIGKEHEDKNVERNDVPEAIYLLFKTLNTNQRSRVFKRLKTDFQISEY